MKLNDSQMLPTFVTEMEQMSDLLQGEQKELDLVENLINKMFDQIFVHTATDLLWRFEKIYDISSKGLTLEERRKNILAKINTQMFADKKSIVSELKKLTGKTIEFAENFGDYSFSVGVVQNDLSPAFTKAIRNYLDTVKPAHLAYELSLIRYEEYFMHIGSVMIDSTLITFEEVF